MAARGRGLSGKVPGLKAGASDTNVRGRGAVMGTQRSRPRVSAGVGRTAVLPFRGFAQVLPGQGSPRFCSALQILKLGLGPSLQMAPLGPWHAESEVHAVGLCDVEGAAGWWVWAGSWVWDVGRTGRKGGSSVQGAKKKPITEHLGYKSVSTRCR